MSLFLYYTTTDLRCQVIFIKILLQYLTKNHLTSYRLCGKINTIYNILTFLNNRNGSLDRLKSE